LRKLIYSECHPLKPYRINKASLDLNEFIIKFNNFKWSKLLQIQLRSESKKVYYSPSINIVDYEGKGISVSIVGRIDNYEFYICYKRPKTYIKKKWFGISNYEYHDKSFCSIIEKQTKQDALDAFTLFYKRDFDSLDERW